MNKGILTAEHEHAYIRVCLWGYSKIRYIDPCLLERVERWWKAKGGVEMNEEVGWVGSITFTPSFPTLVQSKHDPHNIIPESGETTWNNEVSGVTEITHSFSSTVCHKTFWNF
jgi:hypothetical protein